jgi:hypothetical protein
MANRRLEDAPENVTVAHRRLDVLLARSEKEETRNSKVQTQNTGTTTQSVCAFDSNIANFATNSIVDSQRLHTTLARTRRNDVRLGTVDGWETRSYSW